MSIGPGHAYKDKDLENDFDVKRGVNVWGKDSNHQDDSAISKQQKDSTKRKKEKDKSKKSKKEHSKKQSKKSRKEHEYKSDEDRPSIITEVPIVRLPPPIEEGKFV